MNRPIGFSVLGNSDEAADEDRFTLMRCDECQSLTVEGVLPILINTAGQAAKRTTAEKWLCLKCLHKAGIPATGSKGAGCGDSECKFEHDKEEPSGPVGWVRRAYNWARERKR